MHNAIDFSAFRELRVQLPFKNFSVKYVVEGCEHYTLNGHRYSVRAGQYLLANQFTEGFVEIESAQPVKGMCISLAPQLMMEAVASHLQPGTPYPDLALDRFFSTPDFLENQYAADLTNAGKMLRHIERQGTHWPDTTALSAPAALTKELCFDLAGRIVADHVPVFRQLQAIKSVKFATRKDLFRRIANGKEYLDAHFAEPLDVATAARAGCLSEYHFFRLFKAVHGLSPYRYILRKRLEKAVDRLREGRVSLAGIAEESGFADIHAFSKAFKNGMGVSPRAYLRNAGEVALYDRNQTHI